MRRTWIRAPLVLLAGLGFALAPSTAAAKRSKHNSLQLQIETLLEAKEKDVQRCALDELRKPEPLSVDITAFITINRGGHMDCHVNSNLPSPAKEKLRGCVEKVLATIHWPKADSSFVPINKTWNYAIR
jgi:hypothetical protein